MGTAHEHPTVKFYCGVGITLALLTGISFFVTEASTSRTVTSLIVLGMATTKALLVASFFMHLKFDWTKVRVFLIPAMLLATVLVFALMPDITFAVRELAGKGPVVARPAGTGGTSAGHAP